MPSDTIPQPEPSLFLGNLGDLDAAAPVQGFMRLARTYGPIYRLDVLGRTLIVVSSQALVHELSDEARFEKRLHASLVNLRELAGDGLFTAHNSEPNWGKAHRLLMPAFGPLGIRTMFDPMLDIAEQLMLRWERFGEWAVIDVPDNMTRLTLDTIALCAFDTRFNSFYQDEMHPLVDAMVDGLKESGARTRRPAVANRLMLATNRKYERDVQTLHRVADELVAQRRLRPHDPGQKDLLDIMLTGRDPVTGEGLSDENIRNQLVTFLVAGHETTSGLLSFALFLLLRHPEALARTRADVDAVLGGALPRVEHLGRMRYLEQVLMETLRLWPTAPAYALKAKADTQIGGRWPVRTTDTVFVLIPMLHRDTSAWGEDVESFRPERFAQEAYAAIPPDAWKPFGTGQRACIGRPFAMQEAQLVLALILQRFDLIEHDPSYRLEIAETLTLKPAGFRIRVKRRSDRPFGPAAGAAAAATPGAAAPVVESSATLSPTAPARTLPAGAPPLLVLYGSNTGSAEAFAQRIANDAAAQGFAAGLAPLDEHAGGLPARGAVLIVTASYEGQPPDNARQFVAALEAAAPGRHAGVHYAVFGCGNRQWARTYQAVPRRIDEALAAAGATRLRPRGETDSGGDFFGSFDTWCASLWPELRSAFGVAAEVDETRSAALRVERIAEGRTGILRQAELQQGEVLENRELVDMSSPLGRSKRHLTIRLPPGMAYRAGDYLAVLPRNVAANVDRALRRFGFAPDSRVVVHKPAGSLSSLPTGSPISVNELLTDYVELAQPATRTQVGELAACTPCPPERKALEALADGERHAAEVLEKRVSVLDLLERHAACELDFAAFLAMLPPMRARQYSISSSPLWNDQACTLTFAVVDAPALSGAGRYLGTASTMLAGCAVGARLTVAVRPSHAPFHLPASTETPIVMVCAGTGLAPFRGFVQERALQAAAGRRVGRALLFFGCDHPAVDDLYRAEFDAWESTGAVSVRRAFSAAPVDGACFVQDRLWQDRAEVADLFRAGAHVYVCGDGRRMAPAVRETFVRIVQDVTGQSADDARRWADRIERETGRYVADVFA